MARERLSRDTIVDGAIALADAEGLDAVTIRRLAQDHKVTPMALYWHFKDKGELLDGIGERLFADVRLPAPSRKPWPEQLRSILEALLDALRPHPEVAGLVWTASCPLRPDSPSPTHTGAPAARGAFTERAAQLGGYLLNAVAMLVTSEPGESKVLTPRPVTTPSAQIASSSGLPAPLSTVVSLPACWPDARVRTRTSALDSHADRRRHRHRGRRFAQAN